MAKVLKAFKCKVTKRVYRVGEQYDGDRLEELQELGYVEKAKAKKLTRNSKDEPVKE